MVQIVISAIHTLSHILLYVIPKTIFAVFVKIPLTLVEQQIGEQRTFPENEAEVVVVTNWWDKSTLQFFGLSENNMTYPKPLYCGHMQTLLGATRSAPKLKYTRLSMTGADGGIFCVDWSLASVAQTAQGGAEAARGVFLVVPGLASSSSSNYILKFVRYANKRGFHCAVLNARGMGSTPMTTPQLMSAVFTSDLRSVLENNHLLTSAADASLLPHSSFPVFTCGFSLGGLVLCNFLSEEGMKADGGCAKGIKAAFSICAPWDMHESANHMQKITQRLIYQNALTSGLRKYALRHENLVRMMPEIDSTLLFEEGYLSELSTVQEFDKHLVAPHFGFTSAEEYYTASSCMNKMVHVSVPLLCIGALDDPITGPPPQIRRWERLAQNNKNVCFLLMPTGGHLGFMGNPMDEVFQRPEVSHQVIIAAADSALTA